MHYVIIEDDAGIRQVLQDVLQRLETNASFTVLGDGHQAWKWLDQVADGQVEVLPDIAFVDLKMPGPQGYEVAERMRALDTLSNIGIVLMSAADFTPEEYDEVMERSQADRYIA